MKKIIHSRILNYFFGLAGMIFLNWIFNGLIVSRYSSNGSLIAAQQSRLSDSRTAITLCLIFLWTLSFIIINRKRFSWKKGYCTFFLVFLWFWCMRNEPFAAFVSSFDILAQPNPINKNWYDLCKIAFSSYGFLITVLISIKTRWDLKWRDDQLLSAEQREATQDSKDLHF